VKYVEEDDWTDIGMTKPEMRRLRKMYKKEFPPGALGKLKKVDIIFSLNHIFDNCL
jgi:hypothetical protein